MNYPKEDLVNAGVTLDDDSDAEIACLDDDDVLNVEGQDMLEEHDEGIDRRHCVKVFGVTEEGTSISLNVLGYTPYFYVRIPEEVEHLFENERKVRAPIRDWLESRLAKNMKSSLVDVVLVRKKHFWGW